MPHPTHHLQKSLSPACFDTTRFIQNIVTINRSVLREERIFTVFVGRFGAFFVKISDIL